MKCENCPAGWEDRSYEGECNDFGCQILGSGLTDDDCKLTSTEIEKRLRQLEDYQAGKIERPQWVANRFIRELDDNWMTGHRLGIFLPEFPPPRMKDGCYESLHSAMGLKDTCDMAYREGFEAAKKENTEHKTNADRLRAMSNEALAEWIASKASCDLCKLDCKAREQSSMANCARHWLDWLQSPAEGGDEDG